MIGRSLGFGESEAAAIACFRIVVLAVLPDILTLDMIHPPFEGVAV
jgi:hypothetical protein